MPHARTAETIYIQYATSLFGFSGLPILVAHGVPTVLIEAYVRAKIVFVLEQTFKSAINPHISIVLYALQTHLLVLSRLRDDIRSFFPVALTSWSEKTRRKAHHSPDES